MAIDSPQTRLAGCRVVTLLACMLAATASTRTAYGVEPAASTNLPAMVAGAPSGEVSRARRVTNIWFDTDIRQAIQDVSAQTDTVILCDASVQGLVSMSVKDMPLEDCLERMCAIGGFTYMKVKDYYVVARADPTGPLFQQMTEPCRVTMSHATVEQVRSLLHPSLLPYITYDRVSGSMVVTAPEAIRSRILETVKLIDQPNSQVAIEGIVFELTEAGSKQLGLDWQFDKRHVSVGGRSLVGTFTYDSASDVGTLVDVTLRAIVETGKGQVLANPRIVVMNNTPAEIFVGQEKYFSLLNGQASNPYYTLQSIKAGVTLRVVPSIGKNGQITLDLEPEVSDVVTDAVNTGTADPRGNYTAPTPVVTRRHAKTMVSVKDGQTVVIGGLLMEQNRSIVDKVPLAGDIPGIGAAFRNVRSQKQQQEVVILINAKVVDNHRIERDDLAARLEQQYVSPLDAIAAPVKGVAK